VQNTGSVLSIAFVMAVATSSVPKSVLLKVFSGLGSRISNHQIVPFLNNLHTALWCLAAVSLVGAVVSFVRPKHVRVVAGEPESASQKPLEPARREAAAV
jgi:hypothetical protein